MSSGSSFVQALRCVACGLIFAVAGALVAPRSAQGATGAELQIYFIDVEGGQSTLIVTPEHHALLIDTGFAGHANRIVAAARDAGISQIDYLLITHFHSDHDGGVTELAQLMPIRAFIDHGAPNPEAEATSPETRDAFEAYAAVRRQAARHLQPHAGDRLPLKDLEVVVVSSAGDTLAAPLAGAGDATGACQDHAMPPRDPYENPRSTGIVVRYGKFRFLDVGDLTGQPLFNLVCPTDLIGPVDVYLVAHHGGPDAADPATFAALKPRVAIMNNGVKKGGALVTYQALHHVAGLEDVWQLHRSTEAAESNFGADYVANLDESTAYWIKLTANPDGSFQVLNARTRQTKRYAAR